MINKKQELFLQEYLSNGMNGSKAYQTIYKCKSSVARNNASQLLAKPHIKELVEKEKNKLMEKYEIKKENIIDELNWVIENAKEEKADSGFTDRSAILKAIDILNRMSGNYAPIKTEGNVNLNVSLTDNDED